MATVVRHELVLKKQWIKDEDFLSEMSTATLVPGAIAVNIAYLQGRRLKGPLGAFLAVSGTVLPSFIIILLIALFAMPYFANPRVESFLRGCAIAVAGQIAFAAYIFGRKRLKNLKSTVVCAFGIFLVIYLNFHPVWAVLCAGLAGYFICDAQEETVLENSVSPEKIEDSQEAE